MMRDLLEHFSIDQEIRIDKHIERVVHDTFGRVLDRHDAEIRAAPLHFVEHFLNTVDRNGDTAMHGAAYNISPRVVQRLAERGADPQVWKNPNKAGGTPLFIAEGYINRRPRPDAPPIAAITRRVLAAGRCSGGVGPDGGGRWAR